ncbi:excalibur calcium-binding domain-containing protein [Maricaulis salignorans]|uniref:excalibur calcium-binding domain-containing protein n=1 Tax=Maricaulis salignorans TaxID=144026 RepID=UPI001F3DAA3D|nr:excalibur calcium-binding domain-containing protein [Maricaulis salignorans]
MRPDRDRHATRLRNRLRAVSTRAMRRQRVDHIIRVWGLRLVVIGAVLGLAWFTVASLSPWPVPTTLRHLAASKDCDTARAMELAPARRGEPGYWSWLDADHDGMACERWPALAGGRTGQG